MRIDRIVVDIFQLEVNPGQSHQSQFKAVAGFRQGRTVSNKNSRANLDRYDVAILSALATNTRLTTVEIATIVHLSRTAVSRRIATLKKLGVLNNAADVLNYESLGFRVRAVVDVAAPGRVAAALKQELLVRPEVLSVSILAGDGLMSLDIIALDMKHLHGFVASLQKSGDTTTKIVFAKEKSRLTLVERMHLLSEQSGTKLVRA